MNERTEQLQEEKKRDHEQATMWQSDNERFYDWEKDVHEERKKTFKDYQETLREQMKVKQAQKRSIIEEMSQHELMLNNKTLKELESLKQMAY